MRIQVSSTFLLMTFILACSTPQTNTQSETSKPVSQVAAASTKPEAKKIPSNEGDEKIEGICKRMNPPGLSQNLFEPCNQVALQLIYKRKNQTIISIVRTDSEGMFEINVPQKSSWNLSSTSVESQAQVDFTKNPDGTRNVIVILEPTKKNRSKGKS